ncbi:globin-coupled sensor protein [Bacillus sp. FSL M8-0052]|uniref:Globin-coupled sensor protein n=4 Tax=Bacillaceae TaxID=186817 RepID=A0AAJ3YWQ9_9BACI|nr:MULTISPECIES: globin-coupled sensor protein [Bacillus]KKB75676.1 chemotaxis protein [Bacillus sp. TH008]MDU0073475.1 globin-coupled sensor protein [Bacillus sp. IG6]MED8021386.1 globin-coupled sensor protein [Bacillus glycinifermentans]QAT64521.1 globin-coupled sensor protein [Bacillus glycinifermentans]WKB78464.1 globin-coupled sensor protein [Bacillus glycinifermentans]
MLFKKDRKTERSLLAERGNDKTNRIRLSDHPEFQKQLAMVGLTNEDLWVLSKLKPLVSEHIETIVARFYQNLEHESSLMDIIHDNSTVDRLKKTLSIHISEMFSGIIDEAFLEKRIRIAHVHLKIGLLPKWYLCGFQDLLLSFLALFESALTAGEYMRAVKAVTKILNIEQQIVLEAYEEEHARIRTLEEERKAELHRQIKDTSGSLAALFAETTGAVQELVDKSADITKRSRAGTKTASSVEEKSIGGKKELEEQEQQLNKMGSSMTEIEQEIKKLEEIAGQIEKIFGIVTGIAEQTNLLSLNASIESARAGEHGKGFAVVANEVRKLSDDTKKTVSTVSELVDNTNAQIGIVTRHITGVNQLVVKSKEKMAEINHLFDDIVGSMKLSKNQSGKIEEDLKSFLSGLQEVNGAVSQVAASVDSLVELTEK